MYYFIHPTAITPTVLAFIQSCLQGKGMTFSECSPCVNTGYAATEIFPENEVNLVRIQLACKV
ncbi:hypothetical protein AGABI1DRAFT_115419 [Agaricus bisporus var. burnettii JB137-S8]|uniref:Uncharacterized protein n=1 Tax=Agaricus bisporus var. burnettii (strain JB137-S8 / ATCC MYA-4627 / FGSC 10392) TaxID=597362 RepID=K5XR04_AGABU|nr:uncharacterized protein AGABI1DRAFT_115419 [Agaricus bisporus var. burnettii JB137-S8]EKM77270.1 hypothetical protein AGABI1DRAFT_115419 [Agaricus bisporus var. burnettii JB137-S8]